MWYKNQNRRGWFRRIMVKLKNHYFEFFKKKEKNLLVDYYNSNYQKIENFSFFFEKIENNDFLILP